MVAVGLPAFMYLTNFCIFQYSGGKSSAARLFSFHRSSSSDDVATSVESDSSLSMVFLLAVGRLVIDEWPERFIRFVVHFVVGFLLNLIAVFVEDIFVIHFDGKTVTQ